MRFNFANNNKTYLCLHAKCSLFSPNFKQIRILSIVFHEKSSTSNFTLIRPVGAALLHADRRTVTGACRDYVNAPSNGSSVYKYCVRHRRHLTSTNFFKIYIFHAVNISIPMQINNSSNYCNISVAIMDLFTRHYHQGHTTKTIESKNTKKKGQPLNNSTINTDRKSTLNANMVKVLDRLIT